MEIITKGVPGVCSPEYSRDGTLYVANSITGEVLSIAGAAASTAEPIASTGGQLTCITWSTLPDSPDNPLLLAGDVGHAALLGLESRPATDGSDIMQVEQSLVAAEYEATPLLGPAGLAVDGAGAVFFTDAGAPGETGLAAPKGSVFMITPDATLRPLALRCLAGPAGIVVSKNGAVVYVAEQMHNRILRFIEYPAGVYTMSVWAHCAGRHGPVALALHEPSGRLFVARTDVPGSAAEGVISVHNSEGRIVDEIMVPAGPMLTGLTLTPSGDALVVTEGHAGVVCRVPLSSDGMSAASGVQEHDEADEEQ